MTDDPNREMFVMALAQLLLSHMIPKDHDITEEAADRLARNAELVSRSLLKLPIGKTFMASATLAGYDEMRGKAQ